jgi:hypothetical protein
MATFQRLSQYVGKYTLFYNHNHLPAFILAGTVRAFAGVRPPRLFHRGSFPVGYYALC